MYTKTSVIFCALVSYSKDDIGTMHIAEEKVLAVNVYTVSCSGKKMRMVCPFSFSVRFVRLKIQTSGRRLAGKTERKR